VIIFIIIIIIVFGSPAQSRRHENCKVKQSVNDCNGASFSDHCVLEGDRIPFLESHGKGKGKGKHRFV